MTQAVEEATRLETRRRVRAVRVAIVASLSVAVVEIGLALFLGLESLLAEGIHTLLDGVDSLIVLGAVLIAARPADRSHPFGHGKFEAIGAGIEGAFILCAAAGIAYRGIDRLVHGITPERIPVYVCGVMLVAAVGYYAVSLYLMREARETRSPAILAEALHLRTHIYITGGIAAGLLIGALGNWPVADTILALAVAVCLVWISTHVFREVFGQFTDAALPAGEQEELGRIIARFGDRFIEVHGMRTRQAGVERHIEFHLVVRPDTTVRAAHELSHEIEDAIRQHWPTARATIHVEPLDIDAPAAQTWLKGEPKVRLNDASPDDREFIH